jgi:hypothetical protein
MSDQKAHPGLEPKQPWQTPTIEEMEYTSTEAVPSAGPALIDGVFYTH